jgi:biopolymer transport protein ExbB/TolQ
MLVLAQPAGSAAIDSALIAAVVSLVVALLSQLSTSVRDSRARRYERRRAALLDAQDAALELRTRLREYGQLIRAHPGQAAAEFGAAEQHFDDARSALEVAVSRVEDQQVRQALRQWQVAAQISFVSALDLPASREQASWAAMNDAVGRALISSSGTAD